MSQQDSSDGMWASLLPTLLGGFGIGEAMETFGGQRDNISSTIEGLTKTASEQGGFQPSTIRGGGLGDVSFGPEGIDMTLRDSGRAWQDLGQQGGMEMTQRAMMDPTQRTQDIYDRMMAAQQPGIDRQRNTMQEQMHAQGRGGIRTADYGGTPEQLAMEKALAEQRDQSYMSAMGQANAEQMQQYNIGQGLMKGSYMPTDNLMKMGQFGLQGNELMNRMEMDKMSNILNLGLGGLGSEVNMSNVMGNFLGNAIGPMMGMMGGLGGQLDQAGGLGGLWDLIKDKAGF